jgi:hypothetical protein
VGVLSCDPAIDDATAGAPDEELVRVVVIVFEAVRESILSGDSVGLTWRQLIIRLGAGGTGYLRQPPFRVTRWF